jgi:5-(carboxyamino)imidazole ribonucleotide synthase
MRMGVIGGGQLARMMVPPAHRLGIEVWVLEKPEDCPASLAGARQVVGDWSDSTVGREFARKMDVVTLDHEFAPLSVLREIEQVTELAPSFHTMALIADKYKQKHTLQQAGLAVAPSREFSTVDGLYEVGEELGWPLVVKARRGGYDGKGNVKIEGPDKALEALGTLSGALYAESYIPFQSEVAVIVARGKDGHVLSYPVVDTVQEDHICRCVRFPATLSSELEAKAREIGRRAAEAVGSVGVLGVEMFVTKEGEILINELAPRPHNSGHYTLDCCITSQFENHVRAVCGLPLGSVDPVVEQCVMINLLGDGHGSGHPAGLQVVLSEPGAKLHLYGKTAKPGRKLGHLTLLGGRSQEMEERALSLATKLIFKEREE